MKYLPVVASAILLSSCISFGEDPPPSLLVLVAENTVAAGTARTAVAGEAVIVELPDAERALDTQRVPVRIDDSSIAYLEDALWADRPTRLFRNLVEETIAARTSRVVLDSHEVAGMPAITLSGELVDFGYDAPSSSVVVTFDAVRRGADGTIQSRRFRAEEAAVVAEAVPVGAALNRTANIVAAEIADWIGG